MSISTQSDVNDMDRLMKIIGGDISEATKPAPTILENGEEAMVLSKNPTRKDVGDMAKIMENFASTTGVKSFKSVHDVGQKVIKQVVKDSSTDRRLKNALITSKTDNGMKIGIWEIRKALREGLTKKEEVVYYIRNTSTGKQIQASFLVLESAKAIIGLLSAGALMDNEQIQKIASLEIEYRRLRECALHEKVYWHRAKKAKNEFKMDLYEAKFDAAKSMALYTKERLKNIYYKM